MAFKLPSWGEIKKQLAVSLICLLVTIPVSVVGQKILADTHWLDPAAKWTSDRLVSVGPNTLAWIVAGVISLGMYLLLLWRLWRPRYRDRYHERLTAETPPVPCLEAEFQPRPQLPEASYGVGPQSRTWLNEVEDRGGKRPDATLLDDLLAGGITMRPDPIGDALRRMADQPPPPPQRDTPLGEAMAYACLRTWDQVGELPRLIKEEKATAALKYFEQKAADGELAVWGKDRDDDGGADLWHAIHVLVPPEHWRTHWVNPGSLVGRASTTDRPPHEDDVRFYDLMVCRAQIEKVFPSPNRKPENPKPPEDHPLQAEVKAKAQLMRERLASRNHHLGGFDSPTNLSWLAAMWDAEQRGDFLDEYHRSTFMPQGKTAARNLPGDTIAELRRNVIEYKEKRRQANLQYARRRDLIVNSRAMVARFRDEKIAEPFEPWARRQPEYLAIQPHLGDDYQKWVIRNAERDVSAIADGQFLREVARLAKEWRLEFD